MTEQFAGGYNCFLVLQTSISFWSELDSSCKGKKNPSVVYQTSGLTDINVRIRTYMTEGYFLPLQDESSSDQKETDVCRTRNEL